MVHRVIIADDHQLMRDGLRSLLERVPTLCIVGEADNGLEVLRMVKELRPDLVIMDISMPGQNGIDATRNIKAFDKKIKILALSMHADRRFILEELKAGAEGYLLKDSAFKELITAVERVMSGETYLSERVKSTVIDEFLKNLNKKKSGDRLISEESAFSAITAREREVLQLLAEGKSTKEIAALLDISVKTVEVHRTQLMSKLKLNNLADLTRYALKEGIITL